MSQVNNGYINLGEGKEIYNRKVVFIIFSIMCMMLFLSIMKITNESLMQSTETILATYNVHALNKCISIYNISIVLFCSITCFGYSKISKIDEINFLFLIFYIVCLDIFLHNIFNLYYLNKNIISYYSSIYLGVGTSAIKIALAITATKPNINIFKLICKNNVISVLITTILVILSYYIEYEMGIINNDNSQSFYTTFHFIACIIYSLVSLKFISKSLKNKNYIFFIVSITMMSLSVSTIQIMLSRFTESTSVDLVSASSIFMGAIIVTISIFIELIQSNRTNDQLRNELEIFYKIVEENEVHNVIICNSNHQIIYSNSRAKEYLINNIKNSELDLNSKQLTLNDIIPNHILAQGEVIKIREKIIGCKNYTGKIRVGNKIIEVFIQGIVKDDRYNIISFGDITHQENMEKDKIELVKIKEQELVRNEFFANISHELKTPLNIIYSTVQLLTMKSNDKDFKSIYKYHSKSINLNCQRILRLINNIVDITKFDVGFEKPQLINYDIVNFVEEITSSIVNFANKKDIRLVFDTDIEEHTIGFDKDMIERVILNLLSNAIKFTHIGGNIKVHVSKDERWVKIKFIDDGIGIPVESQDLIFERFVQVDKSLNRNNEGSGIGLSIVKSILDLNNGHITVKSDGNSGSVFEVYLPNDIIKEEMIREDKILIDKQVIQFELSDIYEMS